LIDGFLSVGLPRFCFELGFAGTFGLAGLMLTAPPTPSAYILGI